MASTSSARAPTAARVSLRRDPRARASRRARPRLAPRARPPLPASPFPRTPTPSTPRRRPRWPVARATPRTPPGSAPFSRRARAWWSARSRAWTGTGTGTGTPSPRAVPPARPLSRWDSTCSPATATSTASRSSASARARTGSMVATVDEVVVDARFRNAGIGLLWENSRRRCALARCTTSGRASPRREDLFSKPAASGRTPRAPCSWRSRRRRRRRIRGARDPARRLKRNGEGIEAIMLSAMERADRDRR